MQLQSGTLLQGGKYKIERVLGQGGFGITYLATQELFDRRVCIKEFFFNDYCERGSQGEVTSCTTNSKELVDRFLNKFIKEARTISRLDHPNIVRILDIFQENGTAYYAMEYIEGCSLADKVNKQGALSEAVAVDYIKQVASALDYIHQRSINHLDVKPANIMVRQSDNKAILIDFGLSKQYDEQGGQTSTTPVGISHGYAPMEQYNQGGVSTFSPQTDIYALGATLYKLVTGSTPPQAIEVFNEGLTGLPQSLSSNLVAAIKKTMQPKKGDRPQSVSEFRTLLGGQYAASVTPSTAQNCDDESTQIIGATNSAPVKKTSSPQPTVAKVEEGEEKRIGRKWGYILAACVVGAILLFVFNDKNTSPIVKEATVIPIVKQMQLSSTKIIEAPNYKGNTNKASVSTPHVKKIHQKYIGTSIYDEGWIKSKSLDLHDFPVLDAKPWAYNYPALDTIVDPFSNVPIQAPYQLNDKYLHVWKKDSEYNYYAYGTNEWDKPLPMRLIIANNDNTAILWDFQFDNYMFPPKFIEADKSFVDQNIRDFKLCGNILYFAHYHSTYAKSSYGMNGYISALDVETGKVLWTTNPLSCNSDFVIYGDYIITGYGFTDEPDFLYIIDKSNGAFVKKIPLANGPDVIGMKGNHIFIRTYSYEYEFVIE